jgi:hypothetical protein
MFDSSKIFDWIKLSSRQVLAAAIATALFLFLPDHLAKALGLAGIRELLRPVAGAILLISIGVLIAHAAWTFGGWLRAQLHRASIRRRAIRRLNDLTIAEQEFLKPYLLDDTRSRVASVSDGVARELRQEGILRVSSQISTILDRFPYNIQPWAWDYLIKNPHLVDVDRAPRKPYEKGRR